MQSHETGERAKWLKILQDIHHLHDGQQIVCPFCGQKTLEVSIVEWKDKIHKDVYFICRNCGKANVATILASGSPRSNHVGNSLPHTTQVYHGETKVFDDMHLLIIMSMMIEAIKEPRHDNVYASLADTARYWERQLEGYGPGVIELGLEERLTERMARDAFLSVLRDVRTRLESFGEWVPVEFLNGLVMFPLLAKTRPKEQVIKINQAQPASRLLKVVRDLEELVAEQE